MAATAPTSKLQQKPISPLVGSALTQREFKKLLAKAAMEEALDAELRISEKAWQEWALGDLDVDLKLMHLEDMVELALETVETKEAEKQGSVLPMRIDPEGNLESLPINVRRFIRSLERLVEQVEREMAKAIGDKDES